MLKKSLFLPASLLLSAAAALAQAPGGHGSPAPGPVDIAQMQQRKIADLALVLDLKPAQVQRLEALVKAEAPPDGPVPGQGSGADGLGMTALQRAERIEADQADRARGTARRLEALRAFYGSLDDRQKRVFDALERLRGGPRSAEPPRMPSGPDAKAPPPEGFEH
jgi:hypothetical protein